MRLKYIPALIMLIAGAVTSILDIYNKVELFTSLVRLLLVLIIFYILGLIVKSIVNKVTSARPKKEVINEEEINEAASKEADASVQEEQQK